MAKRGYISPDGKARKTAKIYLGDANGLARRITKAYLGDKNGVAREWFSSSVPISTLPVGTTVYLPYVYGGKQYSEPFLIIHQGLPDSTLYDSSCDGTWLVYTRNCLRTESENYWDSSSEEEDYNNDYENSDVHAALTYSYWDIYCQSIVKKISKQVKIPYRPGYVYGNTNVNSGANGLSAQMFLLSAIEVGYDGSDVPIDGATLDYFKDVSDAERAIGVQGFLRTPVVKSISSAYFVTSGGTFGYTTTENDMGYRPAFILPSDTLVDDELNIIA